MLPLKPEPEAVDYVEDYVKTCLHGLWCVEELRIKKSHDVFRTDISLLEDWKGKKSVVHINNTSLSF